MTVGAFVLGILGFLVGIFGALVAYRSYRAADNSAKQSTRSADAAERSAAAAEHADRRARTPDLDLLLAGPFPDQGDLIIYRTRNNGPQYLDDVVVYRPKPPDSIKYHLAVTGSSAGFAEDEIHLGPIALTQETRFTLGCGHAAILPDFYVRIVCQSGTDEWELTRRLPPPRLQLSAEVKQDRRQTLTHALTEIERNLETLKGNNWLRVPLLDQHFGEAQLLVVAHAPDHSGPARDARAGLDNLAAWISGLPYGPSPTQNVVENWQSDATNRLMGARTLFENLRAALESPQATGVRWNS